MLIAKGIYDGNQIKLLESVKIEGKHFVEVRFIEEEFAKEQQLSAFRQARGIWKERPEVNIIFKELEERWQQWSSCFYKNFRNGCKNKTKMEEELRSVCLDTDVVNAMRTIIMECETHVRKK